MDINHKSGFAAILGKPNVGKSTLMNLIIGEKLSIITSKPQTTRLPVKGIYSDDNLQIVFQDLPGYLKPRYALQERMLKYIKNSLLDCDVIIFITDAKTYPTSYDKDLLGMIRKLQIPKLAILNKIDLVSESQLQTKEKLLSQENFAKIFIGSLIKDFNKNKLIEEITNYLPKNPPFYDKEDISDLSLRFFLQEIIREQIFIRLKKEIPYATTVVVEMYKDFSNKAIISANIWVERKTQKIILIGKNGRQIKKIRIAAEKEFHKIIRKRVKLDLWVKIKKNWRKKKNALKEFGY